MGLWQVAGGIYMTAWNNVTRLTQNKASYLMLWKRQTRLYIISTILELCWFLSYLYQEITWIKILSS